MWQKGSRGRGWLIKRYAQRPHLKSKTVGIGHELSGLQETSKLCRCVAKTIKGEAINGAAKTTTTTD